MPLVVEGSSLPSTISPSCSKLADALRGKTVDLSATGQRDNNKLDQLIRCEAKARAFCGELLAQYATCHGSVMSVGAYKGKNNCGEELARLKMCVLDGRDESPIE
jgi:hypothetical protein